MANNILLFATTSYWDLAAEFKPLLHTWSLGIEEQFYLVYPLALLSLLRKSSPNRQIAVVLAAMVTSLLVAQWGAMATAGSKAHSAAFYLLPSRAWELLAGALAALLTPHIANIGRPTCEALSLIGIALILVCAATLAPSTPFPGIAAMPACLGAGLILLFCNRAAFAKSLLSVPPLLGIGLISYSAYLWHQPLLSFARIYSTQKPELELNLLMVAATLALSYLTWRFVEQPCRNRHMTPTRQLISALAITALVLGAAGFDPSTIHATTV